MKLIFLMLACFVAAFVDAIAGGGGLISLPAYIIAGIPSHYALGTNKFASSCGTSISTLKFAKEKKIDFQLIRYFAPMALVGAVLGVNTVLLVDPKILSPLVMLMILVVGIYTLFSKSMGSENAYEGASRQSILLGMFLVFVISFYDGFFGPGAGTFLVFSFTKIFRFDFLHANANAKPMNLISNLTSLVVFAINKKVLFHYAVPIAAAMMFGGYLGAKTSIKNGSKIIKPLFVLMSLGASIKLFIEYFVG